MPLFENCLLASDIDGTLVDNGYISPRNLAAIDFFRSEGGTFVLSTGRSATALGQVFAVLDKSVLGPCVVLNGGMIYDYNLEKIMYSTILSDASKEYTKTVKEKHSDIGIEVHSETNIYVLNQTAETEFHEDYELLSREYVMFDDIKDKIWNKVLYTCNDTHAREKLSETLGLLDDGQCFFVNTAVVVEGKHHLYYEQLPRGTTKAKGLGELCKMLGIKSGGFFAIGDYYNDAEMLKEADVSSAPSDSPDEIKKLANFVGGSCRDGAVADFIEYLTKKRR